MIGRTAARLLAAGLLALGVSGVAQAAHGHRDGGHGGHFAGHSGFHHFDHGGHFHSRVFIGGGFGPYYYPPPYYYYPPAYYPPRSSFYCPSLGAYYPYVQQCPGGWQQVMPY